MSRFNLDLDNVSIDLDNVSKLKILEHGLRSAQSLLLDVGAQLWATPSSDPFYLDVALASADMRFANRRPRVRVRPWIPILTGGTAVPGIRVYIQISNIMTSL